MAIKGKTKSRGAKGVTRGPKPVYVPVRTPLIRRTGLWIAVGSFLVAGLIVALALGFVEQRNDRRERDRIEDMATVVNQYRGQIDPVLSTVGQPIPPTGFDGFPALDGALASLRADEEDRAAVRRAGETADSVGESARSAIGLIEEIPTADLIRGHGFSQDFVLQLLNSQDNFVRGLRLYRETALLAGMAVGAEGRERVALAARAEGVLTVADEVFARGYAEYVEAQAAAEAFEPFSAGGPAGPTG